MPAEDIKSMEEIEDRLYLELARRALAEEGPDEDWENIKAELGIQSGEE